MLAVVPRLRQSTLMPMTSTNACCNVHHFWHVHSGQLQAENGPGTFNHDLVQQMLHLHPDILAGMDTLTTGRHSDSGRLEKKIGDILSLQRRHITQFEFCLDEFNRYLAALRLLEVGFKKRA